MKLQIRYLVVTGLLTCITAKSSLAKMNPNAHIAVTNLVEILPYIQTFSSNLDLRMPRPLMTTDVTKFTGYRPKLGYGRENVSLDVGNLHFTFDVENLFICDYYDKEYSLIALPRDNAKPLNEPSPLTKEDALQMAHKCMARLGYSEKDLPLLEPSVTESKWEPPGAPNGAMLLYYTVEWPWSKDPDWKYFTIEIDALRKRVTHFSTIYPRQEPAAKE
jgi:hypothetical protein